jgi:DNA-binding NarL/FixJ family response regulator
MQFHLERLGGGLHDAIIILSALNDQDTVKRAFSLDALGFIPKTSRPEVMLNAIQLVLSGDLYIPAEILDGQEPTSARVSNKLSAREFQDDLGLTARQIEVLGLLSIA